MSIQIIISLISKHCGQCCQQGGHRREADALRTEFWNLVLLVILYMIQGVPLGLTMGSM